MADILKARAGKTNKVLEDLQAAKARAEQIALNKQQAQQSVEKKQKVASDLSASVAKTETAAQKAPQITGTQMANMLDQTRQRVLAQRAAELTAQQVGSALKDRIEQRRSTPNVLGMRSGQVYQRPQLASANTTAARNEQLALKSPQHFAPQVNTQQRGLPSVLGIRSGQAYQAPAHTPDRREKAAAYMASLTPEDIELNHMITELNGLRVKVDSIDPNTNPTEYTYWATQYNDLLDKIKHFSRTKADEKQQALEDVQNAPVTGGMSISGQIGARYLHNQDVAQAKVNAATWEKAGQEEKLVFDKGIADPRSAEYDTSNSMQMFSPEALEWKAANSGIDKNYLPWISYSEIRTLNSLSGADQDTYRRMLIEAATYREAGYLLDTVDKNDPVEVAALAVSGGLGNAFGGLVQSWNSKVKGDYTPVLSSANSLATGALSEQLHGVMKGVADVGQALGFMLPTIAVSMVTRNIGGLFAVRGATGAARLARGSKGAVDAMKGVQMTSKAGAFGEMYESSSGMSFQQALEQGYKIKDAKAYATINGLLEAGLQSVLGGYRFMGANAWDAAGKALGKIKLGADVTKKLAQVSTAMAAHPATRYLFQTLEAVGAFTSRAGEEFVEEWMQAWLDPAMRNVILDENNEVKPFSEEALYNGLIGGLTAGLFNIAGVTSDWQGTRMGRIIDVGRRIAVDENAKVYALEYGMDAEEGSVPNALANDIYDKLLAGTATDADWGALNMVNEAYSETHKPKEMTVSEQMEKNAWIRQNLLRMGLNAPAETEAYIRAQQIVEKNRNSEKITDAEWQGLGYAAQMLMRSGIGVSRQRTVEAGVYSDAFGEEGSKIYGQLKPDYGNKSVEMNNYDIAFNILYASGARGVDFKTALKSLDGLAKVTTSIPIDRIDAEKIWNAGKSDGVQEGAGYAEQAVNAQPGLADMDMPPDAVSANEQQELDYLGKKAGVRVIITDAQGKVNGAQILRSDKSSIENGRYDPKTATVYLHMLSKDKPWQVVKHEFVHRLKNMAPEEFEKYMDFCVSHILASGKATNYGRDMLSLFNLYTEGGEVSRSQEYLLEEFMGDFTRDELFPSMELIRELCQKQTKTGRRIKDVVRGLIRKFKGEGYGLTNKELRQAEQMFADALDEVERRVKMTENKVETNIGEAAIKTEEIEELEQAASLSETRSSITAQDEQYLDAVKRGDMETAQKMVDAAAKAAGYNIKAYHGTRSDVFTSFDAKRTGQNYDGYNAAGGGFDFTTDEHRARLWGAKAKASGDVRVIPVFLKVNKTFYSYDDPVDSSLAALLPAHLTKSERDTAMEFGANFHKVLDENGINFVDAIRSRGYDSYAQYPGAENITVYDPQQIKSADPVTYDNNNNVIPLSERFNTENEDIRYSVTPVSAANEQTAVKRMETKLDELTRKLDQVTNTLDANQRLAEAKEAVLPEVDVSKMPVSHGVPYAPEVVRIMESDDYVTPADRYSTTTLDPWAVSRKETFGDTLEIKRQNAIMKAVTNNMVLDDVINGFIPGGTYDYNEEGPLRENEDIYLITFDMDTSCPRAIQFREYIAAVEKKAGRMLTEAECINLLELMRAYGQMVPCTYCYVETKRMALSGEYNNWFIFHHNVVNAASDEEAKTKMYGRDKRTGKLSGAAGEVLKEWLADKGYDPTIEEIYADYHTARNSVFNLLDQWREVGKLPDAQTKRIAAVCDFFDIDNNKKASQLDKDAAKEIAIFVDEWLYDLQSGNGHKYKGVNDPTHLQVDKKSLATHHRAMGYAKSSSSAHDVNNYAPYTDQLKKYLNKRDYLNAIGGVRKHSSNDFRIDYVQDYLLFYADLAAGGFMGHTYSKSIEFAQIFGWCGDRINMSIAMYGDDVNDITENWQEGAPWEDVKKLRAASPNIGTMAMVVNDAQLSYALNADWIDMIIPFHASGLKKAVWYNMHSWLNYTGVQEERPLTQDDIKERLENEGFDLKGLRYKTWSDLYRQYHPEGDPPSLTKIKKILADEKVQTKGLESEAIREAYYKEHPVKEAYNKDKKGNLTRWKPHFLPGDLTLYDAQGNAITVEGHHNDKATYLRLCEEYGVHPRFDGTVVTDANGNKINVIDHPNYMKLVKETARTDTPQQPIEFNFNQREVTIGGKTIDVTKYLGGMTPLQYMMDQLHKKAEDGGYENLKEDPYNVVDEFIQQYLGKNRPLGYLTERAANTIALRFKDQYGEDRVDEEIRKQFPVLSRLSDEVDIHDDEFGVTPVPEWEQTMNRYAEMTPEQVEEYTGNKADIKRKDNQRFSITSAQAKRDAGEKLTESAFYSLYSAHKLNLRNLDNIEEQIANIREEGFQGNGSFGVNLMPTRQHVEYRGVGNYNLLLSLEQAGKIPEGTAERFRTNLGEDYGVPVPENVTVSHYGPRKGEYILLVPESGVDTHDNYYRVNPGWRPNFDWEIVKADYDYQPYYEMYSKAYDAAHEARKSISAADDIEYLRLAADPETNREALQRMVDEAANKAGYRYVRYTRNPLSVQNNEASYYLFVVDDKEDAVSGVYGEYKYVAHDRDAIDVSSVMDEIAAAWRDYAEENDYYGDVTEEEINPNDIVDSAGVWDDRDFVTWLFDRTPIFDEYIREEAIPAIKTDDGLIVLGDDYSRMKSADPVTYDDNGNVIPLSERFNTEEDDIRYSIGNAGQRSVDAESNTSEEISEEALENNNIRRSLSPSDPQDRITLNFLNKQETVKVYRAMQVVDGELYPPMAAKEKDEDGKFQWTEPTELGEWDESVERPDKIEYVKNGKGYYKLNKGNGTTLTVAYNPYFHTSRTPLNDQFSSAYKRPNLVTVEGEVPVSELTSGYQAEYAKDPVGEMSWHSGPVSSKLPPEKARKVILSRWFKPVRIVPDAEVAQVIKDMLEGEGLTIPANTITPSLREELEALGVPIEDNTRKSITVDNSSEIPITNSDKRLSLSQIPDELENIAEGPRSPEEMISLAMPKEKQGVKAGIEKNWHTFQRLIVDAGETVHRISEALDDPSLYTYYNNVHAAQRRAEKMMELYAADVKGQRTGKSLNAIFDPIRAKGEDYYRDFQLYLYHQHNIDLMSREDPEKAAAAKDNYNAFLDSYPAFQRMTQQEIDDIAWDNEHPLQTLAKEYNALASRWNYYKNLHNKPVFGVEVTAEESAKEVSRLQGEHEEFRDLAREVYGYVKNLQQYRVSCGLISQMSVDHLNELYPHYVPTYLLDEAGVTTGPQDAVTISSTVKEKSGNFKQVKLMPLHVALANQTRTVTRNGAMNLFGQRLLSAYQQLKTELNMPLPKELEKKRQGRDKVRGDIIRVSELYNSFNPEREETINDIPDAINVVGAAKSNSFTVRLGDAAYEMVVSPELFTAIKALSPSENANERVVLSWLAKANNIFKALCTGYNPIFTAKNFIRDLQDVLFYSRDLSAFARNYPRAWHEIAKGGKYWETYQSLGGLWSSFYDYETGELNRGNKLRKWTLGRIETLNEWVEQAPRLAEFMSAVDKVGGIEKATMDQLMDAMYAAADVTVNFGRKGTASGVINTYAIPFFNPAVQGFSKFVRRFTETKGPKKWANLICKAALFGIAPSLINQLLYADDDDWDELNDSDKNLCYCFKIGDGLWIKIPKGRALSIFGLFVNAGERVASGDEVDWWDYVKTGAEQVAPTNPFTSNIFYNVTTAHLFDKGNPGTTWYGADIESQRLQNYEPSQRYDAKTDTISKWIGKQLGLSPKKINYIIDQYSGIIGDVVLPLLTPAAERNAFVKGFTIDSNQANKLTGEFYDLKEEITYANHKEDAGYSEQLAQRWVNSQASALAEVNQAIRDIENDDTLSGKEKKDALSVQYDLRNEITRNAVDTYGTWLNAAEKYYASAKNEITQEDIDTKNHAWSYLTPAEELTDEEVQEKLEEAWMDYAFRQANRELYGAEYALTEWGDSNVIKKADAINDAVSYDAFFDVYTDYGYRKNHDDGSPYMAIVDYGMTEPETKAMLSVLAGKDQYERIDIGTNNGMSSISWIQFQDIKKNFDYDNNGSYKQGEIEDALRSLMRGGGGVVSRYGGQTYNGGISETDAAILWQISNSGWKWYNNPFNQGISHKIYDALHADNSSGLSQGAIISRYGTNSNSGNAIQSRYGSGSNYQTGQTTNGIKPRY